MPGKPRASEFTALNFGLQLVWGAILAVSLQTRCVDLAPARSAEIYALLAAFGAAIATVVQIVAGRLADRMKAIRGSRLEFYIAGIAVAIPSLFWFYLAPSLAQFTAALALLQVGMNVATGPFAAAIPDYAQPQRTGSASSWLSGYGSLGSAAGLLVAGFVHAPVAIAAILAAALGLSLAITLFSVRRHAARTLGSVELVFSRPLRVLLLSRGAINVGFYVLVGYLFFFVRDSLSPGEGADARMLAALLFLTFTLAAIAGALFAARPVDRFDKRLVVSVTAGVMVVSVLFLAAAQSLPVAFASAAIAGVSWGGFVTADWALACVLLPRSAMAVAMGVWNVATTVPQIAAPLLAAPLVAYGNGVFPGFGPRAAIVLAAIALTLGASLIWQLPAAALIPTERGAPAAS